MQATAAGIDDALNALGIGVASPVGIVLENRPEHVSAVLALLASSRCVVTFSPLQPRERLRADIAGANVSAVIASSELLGDDLLDGTAAVVRLDRDGSVAMLGAPRFGEGAKSPGGAVEMLTSGTTGPPKRVRLTDQQLDASMVSGVQSLPEGRLLRTGVSLVHAPLVHIGGLWGVLAPIYSGRRVALFPRWRLETWVDAVERHQVRATSLVPAAMRTTLDADVPRERLASLQAVLSGTASCPAELADAFQRKYGPRVLTTYGATEFAGAVAGWTLPLNLEWWERKKGSAGRALRGAELRVISSEGTVLTGAVGTLEVRSQQSPAGIAEWQRTSDLAEIDADGFLWIRGRADDAIVRGGFKVHPETVKRALERHPAVREAAVAGMPDPRLGHVPVAAVELRPGAEPPTSAELIALCREELIPYEVPVGVLVLPELPRGPSLKVSRSDLLELFALESSGAQAIQMRHSPPSGSHIEGGY